MIYNPKCRQRCGCKYYEQHQVCCEGMKEEELDSWDPIVHATPIIQAIQKSKMCDELVEKVLPWECGCPWPKWCTKPSRNNHAFCTIPFTDPLLLQPNP